MGDVQLTTVHVRLGPRSYDIEIGAGLVRTAGEFLARHARSTHVHLITDANVADLHAGTVIDSLRTAGVRVALSVLPAGEAEKNIARADQLWNELLTSGADRKTTVVAVGGGVMGDLAGFVAATYARGLRFVQIPTTLLAQVDSSVGGKVGVNLPAAKNMVGAFWQPSAVLIDIDVLATLPVREYRAGLAEVVKYGVILDPNFFEYLERHVESLDRRAPDVLARVVTRCCQLKADVVEQDEREETGLRAVLNYGHTFCHAIETVSGYGAFLHGEAVSIGMICASRLAESLGRIPASVTRRQRDLLVALGLPVAVPDYDRSALIAAMQRDKKVEHGRLRFVLPSRLGHVELVNGVDEALVRDAMNVPGG